jgi:hypothetical protein
MLLATHSRREFRAVRLRQIHGIGEKKLAEYGFDILQEISNHFHEHGIATDVEHQPNVDAGHDANA